jgi:hypothetical protein
VSDVDNENEDDTDTEDDFISVELVMTPSEIGGLNPPRGSRCHPPFSSG